ncbi:MAG: type II secretion system protein M [Candidatus Lambdaproteobacteria bacterium]|nr:type II secretion system protein M [Candidatus Lambdaproteobacteria bacterium]
MRLSDREKVLLLVLALVLAGAGLYLGGKVVWRYEEQLAAEADRLERAARQAAALEAELTRLQGRPEAQAGGQPLISTLERLAGQVALKERVQLTALPGGAQRAFEGVEVRANDLNLDELVQFIHAIENAEPRLVVDAMEITPAFRSKTLLRLQLRVLALY